MLLYHYSQETVLNMVVEFPRWTNNQLEVSYLEYKIVYICVANWSTRVATTFSVVLIIWTCRCGYAASLLALVLSILLLFAASCFF